MDAHQSPEPSPVSRPAPAATIAQTSGPIIEIAHEGPKQAPPDTRVHASIGKLAMSMQSPSETRTLLTAFQEGLALLRLVDNTIYENVSDSPRAAAAAKLRVAQSANSELEFLAKHAPTLFLNNVSVLCHAYLAKALDRLAQRNIKPGDTYSEGAKDRILDQLRLLAIRAARVPLKEEDTRLGEKALGGNPTIQGAAKGPRLKDRQKPSESEVQARIAEKKRRLLDGASNEKQEDELEVPEPAPGITDSYEHVGSGTPAEQDYQTFRLIVNQKPSGALQALKSLTARPSKPPLVEDGSVQERVYAFAAALKRWAGYEIDFMARANLPASADGARLTSAASGDDVAKLQKEVDRMERQALMLAEALKPAAAELLAASKLQRVKLSAEEQRAATILSSDPHEAVETYDLAPPQ